jgi:hypothetical protein
VIKRRGMHHRSGRPSCPTRHGRDNLSWLRRIRTKSTGRFSRLRAYRRLVPCYHPGTSNRIFAEFHALGKHSSRSPVNLFQNTKTSCPGACPERSRRVPFVVDEFTLQCHLAHRDVKNPNDL